MILNLEKTWQKALAVVTTVAASASILVAYIARENDYWAIELIARHHLHLALPLLPFVLFILVAMSTKTKALGPNATNIGVIVAFELARGRFYNASSILVSHVLSAFSLGILICTLLFSGFVIAREYKYMTVDILRKSVSEEIRLLIKDEQLISVYDIAAIYNSNFKTVSDFSDIEEKLEERRYRAGLLEKVVQRAIQENRLATAFLTAHSVIILWPQSSLGNEVYYGKLDSIAENELKYDNLVSMCELDNFPEVEEYLRENSGLVIDLPIYKNEARSEFELGQEICSSHANQQLFFEGFWKPEIDEIRG